MTREAWLVAPPISVATHTAVSCLGCSGWWMCRWIACFYLRSVEVLLLTWTHVLLTLLWFCLTELWFFLWTCRTARDCLTVLQCQLSRPTVNYQRNCSQSCTFTVYMSCSVRGSLATIGIVGPPVTEVA